MVALKDIKADLPDWPDDVLDQWLLTLAKQPDLGWPPPEPLQGHRWQHIITNPVAWWKNVSWKREVQDCSFNKLSVAARIISNKMCQALIEGVDNGYGGDNSKERFQRQLKFLALNGKFERSPVTIPIATGLSVLDGSHRIFALHASLQMSDEDLAKYKVKRPSAMQTVWVGSHKDGETLNS